MPETVHVLAPSWSRPQFVKIAHTKAFADSDLSLDVEYVEAKKLKKRLRKSTETDQAPDIVMLPADHLADGIALPIVPIHRILPKLEDLGAVSIENEEGQGVALSTLWALDWCIVATNLNPATQQTLLILGTFRDPLIHFPVRYSTSLLFHESEIKLPKILGGLKFRIHFPGKLDVEVLRTSEDPNLANIAVTGISGVIPSKLIPINLKKLNWPKSIGKVVEPLEYRLSLIEPQKGRINGGKVNLQTKETWMQLSLAVQVDLFDSLGWKQVEIDIDETGKWDFAVGTLFIDEGTIKLVGGPIKGPTMLLLASSKNATQTVETNSKCVWEAVNVEILNYGTKPATKKLLEKAKTFFEDISKKGSKIGHLMSQAISVNKIRSVFVTYVCVETKTYQEQEQKDGSWVNLGSPYDVVTVKKAKEKELPDKDGLLWWKGQKPTKGQYRQAISTNRPTSKC